jgi:Caspase domain
MLMKRLLRLVLLGALLNLGQLAPAQENNRPRQLTQPETPVDQTSQPRLALVIGNSNYQNATKLNNPSNDAHDLALVLRNLGFEVTEKEDQTSDQIKTLIKEFGARLTEKKGVGLFYFAGHGVQIAGKNYLIPIEAKNLRESSIEFEAVDVGRVLTQMEDADNGLNIVILDACRSNPFIQSWRSIEAGLAEINAPTGTLIAYATKPGKVADDGDARNGLYTSELIRWMKEPGLNIEEMFKRVRKSVAERSGGQQIPAEYTMLTGDFSFASPVRSPTNVLTKVEERDQRSNLPTNPNGENATQGDMERWESIKNSTNSSAYESYLRDYPRGLFTGVALDRLTQLKLNAELKRRALYARVRSLEKSGSVFVSHNLLSKEIIMSSRLEEEFLTPLIQSLKDASLAVTSAVPDSAPQVYGAIAEIKKGRKTSARSSPYVVALDLSIYIEDMPRSTGMQISVANISLWIIDLDFGEIVTIENVEGKGFGFTNDQARKNALKEASQHLPIDLVRKVAEISGKPQTRTTVLRADSRVEEIANGTNSDFGQTVNEIRGRGKVEVTVALPSLPMFGNDSAALYIGGRGWDGSSSLKVVVNGRDVTGYIDEQSKGSVNLKGTIANLNLLDGQNEVVVVIGGARSSPYVFRKSITGP